MLRFVLAFLISTLGLISAVIAVYEFVLKQLHVATPDATAGVYFLEILSLGLYVQLLYTRLKSDRQARYGQTLSVINEGFSTIHELEADGPLGDPKTYMPAFVNLCSKLEHAFSTITATACHVTIKIVTLDSRGRPEAKTFCRSSKSRTDGKNHIHHWIDANKDFFYLFENYGTQKGRFFFCNKLPFLSNYTNTSFETHGRPSDNLFLMFWKWPLPYKSTIVVPICPEVYDKTDDIIGFLCVDSKALGAFKKDYDVDLMLGVSSGLYNLLRRINSSTV